VNPEWKSSVGEGTAVKWPVGIGGKGNEGVAAYVKQINGSIGYVELSFALQQKLVYSRMKNAAGNYVNPSDESFAAAAAQRRLGERQGLLPGDDQCAGREVLADHRHQLHPDVQAAEERRGAKNAKDFFSWAYANGDTQAKALDYVPLPDALVKQVDGLLGPEPGSSEFPS
jgi:phosphate transport system substrate-binding protein